MNRIVYRTKNGEYKERETPMIRLQAETECRKKGFTLIAFKRLPDQEFEANSLGIAAKPKENNDAAARTITKNEILENYADNEIIDVSIKSKNIEKMVQHIETEKKKEENPEEAELEELKQICRVYEDAKKRVPLLRMKISEIDLLDEKLRKEEKQLIIECKEKESAEIAALEKEYEEKKKKLREEYENDIMQIEMEEQQFMDSLSYEDRELYKTLKEEL